MNAQIKKEWLAALRSGDYKQGQGRLCSSDNRFCCLGVLADIAHDGYWLEDVDGNWVLDTGQSTFFWMPGLERFKQTLVDMNDVYDKSFKQIANWIETNIPVTPTPTK